MNTVQTPMYKWQELPWLKIERAVFKLQKRIYQAAKAGETEVVHKLQRLLIKSWSAKCLAVRRVTQDNQGKNTAGVDGIKSLRPEERLQRVQTLKLSSKAQPTRRVWIPKPGKTEQRPLSIPTIRNRAEQALAKLALEPEWEAKFEPNSYGFRPGRSCHDAIMAIFNTICRKAKFVLDANIAQCFDKIDHKALLAKLQTFPLLQRAIRAWLKAGVMDGQELFPTTTGTPQGGIISPLLANVALHGLEIAITQLHPQAKIIRYADDLVAFHPDLTAIKEIKQTIEQWLGQMRLELKPSKTRITHTFKLHEGYVGFDFLGFNIRQYPVGKTHSAKSGGYTARLLGFKTIIKPSKSAQIRHQQSLQTLIRTHRSTTQAQLINHLNPIIKGWTAYHAAVCSKAIFAKMTYLTSIKLKRWAYYRHPRKSRRWIIRKYWRQEQRPGDFAPPGGVALYRHDSTPIKRYTKVQGNKSPFDGDWLYWAKRHRQQPDIPKRVAVLLNRQTDRCNGCGLYFRAEDNLHIDHVLPHSQGGGNSYTNLQLLHAHCHHRKTAQENKRGWTDGTYDKSQTTEEPCEVKVSCTVLQPSDGGAPVA